MKKWVKEKLLSYWLVCNGKSSRSFYCLTFDDGPNPEFTPEVLRVLNKQHAKATFFLVGEKVKLFPELVKQILEDGHQVANHSYSHAEFAQLSLSEITSEVMKTNDVISEISNMKGPPYLFRPPKGVINIRMMLFSIINKCRLYLWNRDPEDFKVDSVDEILDYFSNSPILAGDIILLHDKTPYTASAVDKLIAYGQKNNLQAVTINRLIAR